ncbi:hypothetical protein [Streptomyces sp. NPDC051636]|uniref:hypothetical protein n=1 Tax=Streptomyces sp. NPDC051636 TaxID=3365663 RepID=UPI00379CFBD8
MAVDQLPGSMREFANYLDGLLAHLDQGGGWCGVFWQRDPDGMRACLDGREVPPWDVVEALLQDLAVAYGAAAAGAEKERARVLHAAALAACDARPGARDALGDRLDVMLREQRYAAERLAGLGRLLESATTREEADALRRDLAWARDDHERATARCAELRSRITGLEQRAMRGTAADRRGTEGGVLRVGDGFRQGRSEGPSAGPGGTGPAASGHASGGPLRMPSARTGSGPTTSDRSEDGPSRVPGDAPQSGAPDGTLHDHGTPVPTPRTPGAAPRAAADPAARASAFDPFRGAAQAPPAGHEHPARPRPTGTDGPPPAPAAQPAPAPEPTRQRKRRRGSARFAGMAEDEVPPTAVPQAPAPPPAAEPGPAGRRTPRGARFARAAEDVPSHEPRAEPVDAEAGRAVAGAVEALVRLRAEGRSGEAHALLIEVAYWPATRFPLLADGLQRAGLGADWATLLWEAASLPADRLVAAADALDAAGRSADGEQILRQGVARPAAEIGEAVLALDTEGRGREVRALLDAYVRVRTPEEAARSVAADPRRLVPLLLEAARGVSEERHWDLLHAVRVAGFTA